MVPVGGSLIYSPQKAKDGVVSKVNKLYPGRASAAPIMDLFITLLQLGENRLKELLKQRKENFKFLLEQLTIIAERYNEKVLNTV